MKSLTKALRCHSYALSTACFRINAVLSCLLFIGVMESCSPYNVKQIGAKKRKVYHTTPLKITTPWR